MRHSLVSKLMAAGIEEEMRLLYQGTIDLVIPQLLRPLETGGRSIQPRPLHGDLWADNLLDKC